METDNLVARATEKRRKKHCDLVVANLARDGFGGDHNQAVLVDEDQTESLPSLTKNEVANRLLDRLASMSDARKTRRPSPT